MTSHNQDFSVTVSLENESGSGDEEFAAAANEFLNRLRSVEDLNVQVPETKQPGTRGLIAILTAITVWGAKIGALKAITTIAHDLFSVYRNAEVTLKFKDGSTLKLKGLSRVEAERRIEEHLKTAS
jgi:hypothetical protein